MREFTGPGAVKIADDDNVVAALFERAGREPHAEAFAVREGNTFRPITLEDFVADVRGLAAGLLGLGLDPGTRVCLFSKTRYEFTLLDYAILAAGCVTVPIYESDSADQVKWVAGNSGAAVIFIEDAALKKQFDSVAAELPECKHVFVIQNGDLDELRAHGQAVEPGDLDRRAGSITHDHLATLVYTSGTTGQPKGCMLTHGNLIFEVRQLGSIGRELFQERGTTLMFLPLAHILARVVQFGCVLLGVQVGYATGIGNLTEELPMFAPTWVFSVPRVFEKIYNGAEKKAGGGIKGKLFHQAVHAAVRSSRQREAGKVSALTKAQYAVYDKLVLSKIRAATGGKLRWAISGGAPLGERLGHFFNGLGMTVLEGYGLTETTAGATVNVPDFLRIGTVGRPIPGVAIRIEEDGEVLIKGGVVFKGYWANDDATAATMRDGWLATGDLGSLDDAGFLRITGRKKDLIITAGGKNVQPAELEDAVQSNPLVSQCVVVGDARPFIAALVTLDPDELPGWAGRQGKPVLPADELMAALAEDPDLRAAIQPSIDEANQHVSRAESIREFRVLPRELTIEGGELTPTLKVKRNVVLKEFAGVIDGIYGGPAS